MSERERVDLERKLLVMGTLMQRHHVGVLPLCDIIVEYSLIERLPIWIDLPSYTKEGHLPKDAGAAVGDFDPSDLMYQSDLLPRLKLTNWRVLSERTASSTIAISAALVHPATGSLTTCSWQLGGTLHVCSHSPNDSVLHFRSSQLQTVKMQIPGRPPRLFERWYGHTWVLVDGVGRRAYTVDTAQKDAAREEETWTWLREFSVEPSQATQPCLRDNVLRMLCSDRYGHLPHCATNATIQLQESSRAGPYIQEMRARWLIQRQLLRVAQTKHKQSNDSRHNIDDVSLQKLRVKWSLDDGYTLKVGVADSREGTKSLLKSTTADVPDEEEDDSVASSCLKQLPSVDPKVSTNDIVAAVKQREHEQKSFWRQSNRNCQFCCFAVVDEFTIMHLCHVLQTTLLFDRRTSKWTDVNTYVHLCASKEPRANICRGTQTKLFVLCSPIVTGPLRPSTHGTHVDAIFDKSTGTWTVGRRTAAPDAPMLWHSVQFGTAYNSLFVYKVGLSSADQHPQVHSCLMYDPIGGDWRTLLHTKVTGYLGTARRFLEPETVVTLVAREHGRHCLRMRLRRSAVAAVAAATVDTLSAAAEPRPLGVIDRGSGRFVFADHPDFQQYWYRHIVALNAQIQENVGRARIL